MADLKRSSITASPGNAVRSALPLERTELIRKALADLAAMGGGEVAYIRQFRAADLHHLFPQTAELHPSVRLFALFGADGTPLMLADTREAILSGAWQNDLAMIALH